MTDNRWGGRILLILAYSAPVLAAALYVAVALAEVSIPTLDRSETSTEHDHADDHLFMDPGALYKAGTGTGEGAYAPYFELELEDGTLVTLTDLLEAEKPTFLYFWATT